MSYKKQSTPFDMEIREKEEKRRYGNSKHQVPVDLEDGLGLERVARYLYEKLKVCLEVAQIMVSSRSSLLF